MSAWLCADVHLSAMTQQMFVEGILDMDELDHAWQLMRQANLYALHIRYGDDAPPEDATEIEVEREMVEARLDKGKVMAATRCFYYQCAEFDDFDKHPGVALVKKLQRKLAGHDDPDLWDVRSWEDVIEPPSERVEHMMRNDSTYQATRGIQ